MIKGGWRPSRRHSTSCLQNKGHNIIVISVKLQADGSYFPCPPMKDVVTQLLEQCAVARACTVCSNVSQFRCSGCKLATYCSHEHQRSDWSGHRSVCRFLVHTTTTTHIGADPNESSTGIGAVIARVSGLLQSLASLASHLSEKLIYQINGGVVARFAQLLSGIVSSAFDQSREKLAQLLYMIPDVASALRGLVTADADEDTADDSQLNSEDECRDLVRRWGDVLLRALYSLSSLIAEPVRVLYQMVSRAAKRAAKAMGALLDFAHDRFSAMSMEKALDAMYLAITPVVLYTSEAPTNLMCVYSQAVEALTFQEDDQRTTVMGRFRDFWRKYMGSASSGEKEYAAKVGPDRADIEIRSYLLKAQLRIYNAVFGERATMVTDYIMQAVSWILDPVNYAYTVVSRWVMAALSRWSFTFVPKLMARIFGVPKKGTALDQHSLEPDALETIKFIAENSVHKLASDNARLGSLLAELRDDTQRMMAVNAEAMENLKKIQRRMGFTEYSRRLSSLTWSLSVVAARQLKGKPIDDTAEAQIRLDGQELVRLRTGFTADLVRRRESAAAAIIAQGHLVNRELLAAAPDAAFAKLAKLLAATYRTTVDDVYTLFGRSRKTHIGDTADLYIGFFANTSALERFFLWFTDGPAARWGQAGGPVRNYDRNMLQQLVIENKTHLLATLENARKTFAQPWRLLAVSAAVLTVFSAAFTTIVLYRTFINNVDQQYIDSFLINQIGIKGGRPELAVQGLFARVTVDAAATVVRARDAYRRKFAAAYGLGTTEGNLAEAAVDAAKAKPLSLESKSAMDLALRDFKDTTYKTRITAAMFESTVDESVSDDLGLTKWLLGNTPDDLRFIVEELRDPATPAADLRGQLASDSPGPMFRYDQYGRLFDSTGFGNLFRRSRVNKVFADGWTPRNQWAPENFATATFQQVLTQAVYSVAPVGTQFEAVLKSEMDLFANGIKQTVEIVDSLPSVDKEAVRSLLEDRVRHLPGDKLPAFLPAYTTVPLMQRDPEVLALPEYLRNTLEPARVAELPDPVAVSLASPATPPNLLGRTQLRLAAPGDPAAGTGIVLYTEPASVTPPAQPSPSPQQPEPQPAVDSGGGGLTAWVKRFAGGGGGSSTDVPTLTYKIETVNIYPSQIINRFIDGTRVCSKSIKASVWTWSERVTSAIMDTLLWRSTIYERAATELRDIEKPLDPTQPVPQKPTKSWFFWRVISNIWGSAKQTTENLAHSVHEATVGNLTFAAQKASLFYLIEYLRTVALFFSYIYFIIVAVKAAVSLVLYVQVQYQVQDIKAAADAEGHTGPLPIPAAFEPYIAPGYVLRVLKSFATAAMRTGSTVVIARTVWYISIPTLLLFFGAPYIAKPLGRIIISAIPGAPVVAALVAK